MAKQNRAKQNRAKQDLSRAKRARAYQKARAERRAAPAKARAAAAFPDDRPPDNPDEFRRALAARIMTFMGMPRRCRVPVCRRTGRCLGPGMRCHRDFPAPEISEEERKRVMSSIQRALARRQGEAGG